MRLNDLQRVGIVASVVWALAGPMYVDKEAHNEALETFNRVHRACLDAKGIHFDCIQRARDASDSVTRYPLLSANWAFVALVPVALGWLVAYALVYGVRRIRAGFKPSS